VLRRPGPAGVAKLLTDSERRRRADKVLFLTL